MQMSGCASHQSTGKLPVTEPPVSFDTVTNGTTHKHTHFIQIHIYPFTRILMSMTFSKQSIHIDIHTR